MIKITEEDLLKDIGKIFLTHPGFPNSTGLKKFTREKDPKS
ncbi:MAG TPA: hypothetical protein PKJ62_04870 [Bacteroidia bacterium]|nr:hypothetical protein [Bacteroidia bacterium]HNS13631.1 hypothetical protein [Bacteroidia bacterium]